MLREDLLVAIAFVLLPSAFNLHRHFIFFARKNSAYVVSQVELLNLPYFLLWKRIWSFNWFSFDLAPLCIGVRSWNCCLALLRWQLIYAVSLLTVQELFRGFWEGSCAPFWLPFLGFGMSGTDFLRCLVLCRSSLICAFCAFYLAMFDLFHFLCFALCLAFFASDKLSFCLLYSIAFLFLSLSVQC